MRKTALVTGASRGIGRAIALQLASDGLQVGVHYNTHRAAAEETLAQMKGDGHALLGADLSDPESIPLLAQAALDALGGRVDVLVHNAGIYEESPLLETSSLNQWRAVLQRQMQVNFWAGADLAYLFAPAMAQAGWGRIIQIASRAGLRGEASNAGYGASKAAQLNFIKSLAVELAPQKIGCFGIAPGWTDTEMASESMAERGKAILASIPLGRLASPEDVAGVLSFLVSPAADYLTGITIDVNGASYLR